MSILRLVDIRRCLLICATFLVFIAVNCGGGTPSGPAPAPSPPPTPPNPQSCSGQKRFGQGAWDVSVFCGTPAGGGDNLTGNFTNSSLGGFGGTLTGVLTGTLDSGTFNGSLTTITAGGCSAERRYTGSIDSALNWTPGNHVNDCGGASPLTAPVQAAVVTSPPCSFTAVLSAETIVATGGTLSGTVTTSAGCGWAAGATVPWIAITGAAQGTGSGSVTLSVSANPGPVRTGTVVLATRSFTITQAAAPTACSYSLSPNSTSVPASGGSGTFEVRTAGECAWSAVSSVPWLSVSSSGTGNGTVTFSAANNPDPGQRTGTVTVAGQTFTVTQAGAAVSCTFTATPSLASAPSAGGTVAVTVTASAASCAWTAASDDSFLTVSSGGSGTGNGTVTVTVAPNTGTANRSGTVTVAGQTVSVTQTGSAAPCTFTATPSSTPAPAAGGVLSVSVTASIGSCAWTAVSNAAFLSITAGASGTGNGTVTVTAAPNTGTDNRTGTVTVAGQTVTVTQAGSAAPCTFTATPSSLPALATGGVLSVTVTASIGSCAWTAVSNAAFLSITTGASGTGNGTVTITAAPNAGTDNRIGTVTVAGQTVTINQAGASTPCTFAVNPVAASVSAAGGAVAVTITATPSTCAWTTVSNNGFLSTNAANGTGNGIVTITAAPNTATVGRSGTVTVAGQTVTITQAGTPTPCGFTVSPGAATIPAAGGSVAISVTATVSSCQWTAVSNFAFLTITGGASGTGNGTVTITAAANGTIARQGTVTIAGQTVTITQGANPSSNSLTSTFSPNPAPWTDTTGCGFPNASGSATWRYNLSIGVTGPPVTVSTWVFRFFNDGGAFIGNSETLTASDFQNNFRATFIPSSGARVSAGLCNYLIGTSSGFVEVVFNGTDAGGFPHSLTTTRLRLLPQGGVAATLLEGEAKRPE